MIEFNFLGAMVYALVALRLLVTSMPWEVIVAIPVVFIIGGVMTWVALTPSGEGGSG